MGPKNMYRMSHNAGEYQLSVLFKSNFDMTDEVAREAGQDLSHFPHQERRTFMIKLHDCYKNTRCLSSIIEQLSSDPYCQFVTNKGYSIDGITLLFERNPDHYCYQLYLGSAK